MKSKIPKEESEKRGESVNALVISKYLLGELECEMRRRKGSGVIASQERESSPPATLYAAIKSASVIAPPLRGKRRRPVQLLIQRVKDQLIYPF